MPWRRTRKMKLRLLNNSLQLKLPTYLELRQQKVPVVYQLNRRLKRVHIRVCVDKILVKSPHLEAQDLVALLNKQQDWIDRAFSSLPQPEWPQQVLFLGEYLPLESHLCLCQPIRLERVDSGLRVHLTAECELQQVLQAIDRFLLAQGREYLYERLGYWSAQMGVIPNQVRFKRLKSRWGSCSSKSNINLNYRMIQLTPAGIDAILVHELAHLSHLNHGPLFWQLVHQYIPDYRARDLEIKRLTPLIL